MRIVHFSKTLVAGAVILLVRALQRHTDYNVRLVNLERGEGWEDYDVIHAENPDEVFELAEKADIIHLHNYLDYWSKDFYPVDFDSLRRQGKVFVRQFLSHPAVVAREMRINVTDVLTSSIPSLVIAQFQERYYPKARVVPVVIPQDAPGYSPSPDKLLWGVFFSPSSFYSVWGAWGDRWHTKGAPETLSLIKRVARHTGCTIKCMTSQPLVEVMREKRRAFLVIDDLVTGSYHLSGLEGLSLGKPVLAFLDDRVQRVLHEISGSDACPFINTRLEDALEVLVYLLEHPDELADLGKASRAWIERYWSDRILVQHYVDVYQKLLTNPGLVVRQESLRLDGSQVCFQAVTLPDLVYHARANRYYACLPITAKAWESAQSWLKLLAEWMARYLPGRLLRPLRYPWHILLRLFRLRSKVR